MEAPSGVHDAGLHGRVGRAAERLTVEPQKLLRRGIKLTRECNHAKVDHTRNA